MEESQHDPSTLSDEGKEQLAAALAEIQDATFEVLFSKPTRETTFFVHVAGPGGKPRPVRLRYRALSPKAYDKLVSLHQPTETEARKGATWDEESFPPAIVAAVSLVPKLTEEQAAQLLQAENWSRGEGNALFYNALNVCNAGLDVPFSAGD